MGEILGIGVTHYPPMMSGKPEGYAGILKGVMRSPNVPDEMKDPKNWPSGMQDEWENEVERAEEHAEQHRQAFKKVRAAIDDFKPDAVFVFGDDQYENFHEDIIPPYCVYIADQYVTKPFARIRPGVPEGTPTVWNDSKDKVFVTPGHPRAARHLTHQLFYAGFECFEARRRERRQFCFQFAPDIVC